MNREERRRRAAIARIPNKEWLSGEEAIAAVMDFEQCSRADAIELLHKAITVGNLRLKRLDLN
jgi:hypothetical protein